MATWEQFAVARPAVAERGRELLLIEQPDAPGPAGLGYLATLRADGAPRIHPISPVLLQGHLYAYVLRNTHKNADLRRDGRYALHSWPKPFFDDGFDDEEVMLAGRAVAVTDRALHERISNAVGDRPESGQSYELLIERAFHKSRADGRVVHVTWSD